MSGILDLRMKESSQFPFIAKILRHKSQELLVSSSTVKEKNDTKMHEEEEEVLSFK